MRTGRILATLLKKEKSTMVIEIENLSKYLLTNPRMSFGQMGKPNWSQLIHPKLTAKNTQEQPRMQIWTVVKALI